MNYIEYRREISKEFFVKFSDGTHARVLFKIVPDWNMKRHFGTVKNWFNPAVGSTATEFDPSKQIPASSH